MYIDSQFVKYNLKDGDTLESVAEELNISIEYLMLTHNLNAEMYDKIKSSLEGFPKHLTEVFIHKEIVKTLEKKEQRKTGYVIWSDRFYNKKMYGLLIENYEKDTLINKIHYQVEIVYLRNDSNKKIIELNRKQVYINNKQPETIIEQLADTISKTFFPIQVQVSSNGELENIENFEEIKGRWVSKKASLLDYYKGEIAEKIIAKTDNYFKNKYALMESLTENWFLNLFFKPIYGSYSTKKEVQYKTSFPTTTAIFEITQNLEEVYSKTNKLIVNVKGESMHSKTINEAVIQYKLNDEDKSIFSLLGIFTSNNKKTQVEIYQQ